MKWSIWAICTCDCKVNTGFHCWDHWLFLCCLYVVLLAPWEGCRGPQDGSQAASWAQSKSPSTHRHPTALETCSLCVCSALRKRMASLSCCISPTPGGWESSGGGKGTLYQEVLYPEKQILHDWTAAFVLYCLYMCVCGFFFPSSSPGSFTFLHTHSSSSSPLLLSFVLGWGEKMCVGFLEETKQHKTKKITVYFGWDQTKRKVEQSENDRRTFLLIL